MRGQVLRRVLAITRHIWPQGFGASSTTDAFELLEENEMRPILAASWRRINASSQSSGPYQTATRAPGAGIALPMGGRKSPNLNRHGQRINPNGSPYLECRCAVPRSSRCRQRSRRSMNRGITVVSQSAIVPRRWADRAAAQCGDRTPTAGRCRGNFTKGFVN